MDYRTHTETDWYDDLSPAGSTRHGYVTKIETEPYLVNQIRAFVSSKTKKWIFPDEYPTLTIHECWSGYSEYTITSQWHEITLEWGGFRFDWDSTAAFFRDLSEVEEYYY